MLALACVQHSKMFGGGGSKPLRAVPGESYRPSGRPSLMCCWGILGSFLSHKGEHMAELFVHLTAPEDSQGLSAADNG